MAERKEAFMRIIVAVVSGIILGLWKVLIQVLTVIHWIYVIFSGNFVGIWFIFDASGEIYLGFSVFDWCKLPN